jgi:chromosome segregation ATPase
MDLTAHFKLEEKMYRGFIIVFIMQLGFFIHGCTTLEYMDGSSKEELKKYKMSKYEMIDKIEKAKADNTNLQRQVDILNTLVKEKQRIIDEKEKKITEISEENKSTAPRLKGEHNKELLRLREKNELLSQQIKELQSENQRINEENQSRIAGLRGEDKDELVRLREKNELLSQQIKELQSENQRIREEKEITIVGLRGENKDELVRLREKNELLSQQIKELQSENQRINEENQSRIAGLRGEDKDELVRLREKNELLREQIKNVTKENQKVTYENKSLVKIVTRQKGTLLSQLNALKKYTQKLKIKVLSLDSKNSAEKTAKKLNEIGYDIKSVSYAPQSKFSRNTVYFVPEFKDEAERLVVSLGGNTTFKRLDWPSVFDLIVVTGKNP